MKRQLLMMVLGGILGAVALSDSAEACHKKKCAKQTACAPAPVVCEPVVCEPVVCEPVACAPKVKKHCGLMGKLKFGHHKKAAPVACEAPMTTVYYSPVSATPQASAQN